MRSALADVFRRHGAAWPIGKHGPAILVASSVGSWLRSTPAAPQRSAAISKPVMTAVFSAPSTTPSATGTPPSVRPGATRLPRPALAAAAPRGVFGKTAAVGRITPAGRRRATVKMSSSCQGVFSPLMGTKAGRLEKSILREPRFRLREGGHSVLKIYDDGISAGTAAFAKRSGRSPGTNSGT